MTAHERRLDMRFPVTWVLIACQSPGSVCDIFANPVDGNCERRVTNKPA